MEATVGRYRRRTVKVYWSVRESDRVYPATVFLLQPLVLNHSLKVPCIHKHWSFSYRLLIAKSSGRKRNRHKRIDRSQTCLPLFQPTLMVYPAAPPHLFDRQFDRAHHDPLLWRALDDGFRPSDPAVPHYLWSTVARSEPIALQHYSYPLAKHWMADPNNVNSAIGIFDFAGRLNTALPQSTFGQPYFSLPMHGAEWTPEVIDNARLVVTCELLPQDTFSPYPSSAKKSGLQMLSMLQLAYNSHDIRSGGTSSYFTASCCSSLQSVRWTIDTVLVKLSQWAKPLRPGE